MGDFELMTDLPVHTGEGSLSMADANTDGVQRLDIFNVDSLNKLISLATAVVATITIFFALLAIWWESSSIATIAFCFPLVTSPIVIIQRYQLQWGPSFREIHNKLRLKVNELAFLNCKLKVENDRLEQQFKSMSRIEEELNRFAHSQGKDVNQFKALLKESKAIQEEMEPLLVAQEYQAVISALIASERKVDNVVSERELNRFITRIKGLNVGGRASFFKEDSIRRAFEATDHTPADLLDITESILTSKSSDLHPTPTDENNSSLV